MINLDSIAHFDVDKNLSQYLKDNIYSFSLISENISKVKNLNKIEVISFKTQSKMNPHVLDFFPNLKLLITRTVGIDHIDLDYCKKRNIAVYNIPDYGAYNIAEHAMALLLNGAKNIIPSYKQTQKGNFSYQNLLSFALRNKLLGVIGTGKIGFELIKMAKAFGMKIYASDPYIDEKLAKELGFEYVSLDKLLESSDFISIHVPLLAQTKHMIGEEEIKKMKENVILVNTSRGGVIDTKALIKHIKKFKAVGLDVLENEQNFCNNDPLLKFDNITITPHMAFYSDESIKTIAKETLANIKRFERGDKINKVV